MSDDTRSLLRNASVVAAGTLASRILGFFRDMAMAYVLGAGPISDAFFVAFRLPNLLRRLTGEGAMTMAFIPVFSRVRQEQGLAAAFALARGAFMWQAGGLLLVTLLVVLLARPITSLVAPGFTADPEIFDLAVTLTRICFPYVIFISAVALCMGVLHPLGHFLSPAVSPCILNILLIGACAGAWLTGAQGGDKALWLAWGSLAAGIGQLAFQLPFLGRAGFSLRGPTTVWDENLKRVFTLLGPSVFGAAVYQTNTVLGTILASLLPFGSVSYLYYADRLVELPLGVFGLALSTAALPSLAKLRAQGETRAFVQALEETLALTLFIALPATAGLLGLAEPLIRTLFGHGRFSPQDVAATAGALAAFALGMPATSVARPLVSAFYAMEDTATPVKIALGCMLINVLAGLGLMRVWGHVGLALAVALATWANAALLMWAFRRRTGMLPAIIGKALWCLALSLPVYLGAALSARMGAYSLALIPLWGAVYLALARASGLAEARTLLDLAAAKLRTHRSAG